MEFLNSLLSLIRPWVFFYGPQDIYYFYSTEDSYLTSIYLKSVDLWELETLCLMVLMKCQF